MSRRRNFLDWLMSETLCKRRCRLNSSLELWNAQPNVWLIRHRFNVDM